MLARSASITAFTRRDGVRLAAIGVLIIVALGAILAVDALPGPFNGSSAIVEGVATADIRAPRALTYTSEVATEQRREEVRDQVPPQYDYTIERGRVTADLIGRVGGHVEREHADRLRGSWSGESARQEDGEDDKGRSTPPSSLTDDSVHGISPSTRRAIWGRACGPTIPLPCPTPARCCRPR